jgi:hypothetical protein
MGCKFISTIELASRVPLPIAFQQVIFGDNSIMSNKSQPHIYLERNLALPQVFESSIHSTATQRLVHITDSEFVILCPFPERFIWFFIEHSLRQNMSQVWYRYICALLISRNP